MTALCILAAILDPGYKVVCSEMGSEKKYVKALLCTEAEKESLKTLDPTDKAVTLASVTLGGKSTMREVFEELATRKEAPLTETTTTKQVSDYLGSLLLCR